MPFAHSARALPRAALAALAPLAAALGACDLTTEADQDTFHVSFATDPAPTAEDPADITVTGGGNTLVISGVDFVIDDAGLSFYNTEAGCAGGGAAECFPIEGTPLLVSLPIGGDEDPVVTPIELRGPERIYEDLVFGFHTPEAGAPGDAAFLQAHPAFEGVGVRVTGTWNGTPFEFERPLDAEVLVAFDEVFVGDERWNLTVATAVDEWFLTGGTTPEPFDPATAVVGGANDSRFVGNVLASFRAFRDFDRDGDDDSNLVGLGAGS